MGIYIYMSVTLLRMRRIILRMRRIIIIIITCTCNGSPWLSSIFPATVWHSAAFSTVAMVLREASALMRISSINI